MRKFLYLIFFLIATSHLSAVFAISKKEVQTLVENHQYVEAIQALQTMMKQPTYAKDGDCNKLLGQSLCMTGQYKGALRFLETAVRLNRRSGAQWYLAITRQHLYDFEGAIEAIEAYRPVLKSDVWLERADSLEAECQQGLRAFNHIEDVEIIDSMFVYKPSFFNYYNLGPESGKLGYNEEDGLFFENQSSDYRIFISEGVFQECYKIQDKWEDRHLIKGLGSDDFKIIAPFMRTDGETLYFACDSTPGIGGLDIYKTRYNSEEGEFFQPERLGMPFNSPFDDYMMAIDETHHVGWWATERGDDPEHILIYIFKINEDPAFLEDPSVSRARIDCIADSWKEDNYDELMAEILSTNQNQDNPLPVRIVINDQKIYDSNEQFQNSQSKNWYEQNLQTFKLVAENESLLDSLRAEYITASKIEKQQLASQIHQIEEELSSFYRQIHQVEKKYRSLEQK